MGLLINPGLHKELLAHFTEIRNLSEVTDEQCLIWGSSLTKQGKTQALFLPPSTLWVRNLWGNEQEPTWSPGTPLRLQSEYEPEALKFLAQKASSPLV